MRRATRLFHPQPLIMSYEQYREQDVVLIYHHSRVCIWVFSKIGAAAWLQGAW